MPHVNANKIEIEYDTFGKNSHRPLLLIIGLGTQMINWNDDFCRKLVDKGHFVIRFDNRDAGKSSHLGHLGIPDLQAVMTATQEGGHYAPPYTLGDMAADAVGLLDALNLDKAHVCGISMGGMIGQVMAIEHPHRLASLISMQSSTGDIQLPPPTPEAMEAMISAPPEDRDVFIDYLAGVYRAFSGGSVKFSEQLARDYAAASYDRGLYPEGFTRQMTAIMTYGSRTEALRKITIPTLVIHGDSDALVPPEHGKATADAISGANFLMVQGLGHGMVYPDTWDEIVDAITTHTEKAETRIQK